MNAELNDVTIKARFVVSGEGPIIENGFVEFQKGRITEVGRGSPRIRPVDLGDVTLFPGFVNAHTHLELSDLAGRIEPGPDFCDWLRRIVTATQAPRSPDQIQVALRIGVLQSIRSGVTALGDITRFPAATRSVLASSPLRVVSFGEVTAIGNRRNMLDDRLADALRAEPLTQSLRIGLSPHAPYSVDPIGLRKVAEIARTRQLPVCVHAAESPDEDEFVRNGTGPFAELLKSLGIWEDSIRGSNVGTIELLNEVGLLTPRTVLPHANYVSDADIDLIAKSQSSVAYCPRTHAAFGHTPHRFREMLARGINVCLGTDSLASNPSLSLLDEIRFLRQSYPDFPSADLARMATLNGAQALGVVSETGSITVGKWADLVSVKMGDSTKASQWDSILDSNCEVVQVWMRGAPQISAAPG